MTDSSYSKLCVVSSACCGGGGAVGAAGTVNWVLCWHTGALAMTIKFSKFIIVIVCMCAWVRVCEFI